MWMRYAAFAAPILLVGAITVAIVLTSDAGPQLTSAAVTESRAVASPPAAPPQATPTPPCENGTVVPSPADNDGLAADCALLLGAKDPLRGTATLNWSASLAIADWTGVTLGGTPQRVTELSLVRASLDGSIPAQLGGLAKLQRLKLSGNALTGAIGAELGSLSELELLYLNDNQLTGAIPAALGNLATLQFLSLSNNALTGSIPAALGSLSRLSYADLSSNQLSGAIPVELADTGVQSLYVSGNSFTGCIPAELRSVSDSDLATLGLTYCAALPSHTLTTSLTGGGGRIEPAPGPHSYRSGSQVRVEAVPGSGIRIASWGGDCASTAVTEMVCLLTMDGNKTASVTFERITYTLTANTTGVGTVTPSGTATHFEGATTSLTASWNAATHVFLGWEGDCSGTTVVCWVEMTSDKTATATFAEACTTPADPTCIVAVYEGAPGAYAAVSAIPASALLERDADGRYRVERGQQYTVVTAAPLPAGWTRFWLDLSPLEFGTPSPVSASQLIPPVGTTYTFTVSEDEAASTLITFDLKEARPFIRPRPDGKPEIGATVVTTVFSVESTAPRYNSYDTTGEVAEPGSYAFLADPADTTSAVSTYEALRDGTTTALLIHKSDAHGASQAALYDTVEAGDTFEWKEADDCFVRYTVTAVKPDPAGTVPRKSLGVESIAYAFTGCSGAIASGSAANSASSSTASITWGALPNLGGTSLTVPIVQGSFQLVPAGWTGATKPVGPRMPMRPTIPEAEATSLAEARTFPHWRDPELPEGWQFTYAESGDESESGYFRAYYSGLRLTVSAAGINAKYSPKAASETYAGGSQTSVRETLQIAGRPARVHRSLTEKNFNTTVLVWDEATRVLYRLEGNLDSATLIALAQSMFE